MDLEGLKVFIKLIKNSTKPLLKSVQVPTPKVLIMKTKIMSSLPINVWFPKSWICTK